MKKKSKQKNNCRKKPFNRVCYLPGKKGHMSKECKEREHSNKKKNEKAGKTVDEDEDSLVLCLFT